MMLFSVDGRSYKLIRSAHYSDNSKDCRVIGNCVSARYLKNDTLHITIYTDNLDRDLNAYRDSFTIQNDTLSLNLIDTARTVYSYVYNKVKNKIDTFIVMKAMFVNRLDGWYDSKRNEYALTGFNQIPKDIQFNHSTLCDCPTQPVSYDIYKNDTINIINANGRKEGVWIRFFDTGEPEEKKYFENGEFKRGQLLDRNGNDLHVTYESENRTYRMEKGKMSEP
jgi:hypothetical protein